MSISGRPAPFSSLPQICDGAFELTERGISVALPVLAKADLDGRASELLAFVKAALGHVRPVAIREFKPILADEGAFLLCQKPFRTTRVHATRCQSELKMMVTGGAFLHASNSSDRYTISRVAQARLPSWC